jgi:hypothetical protein
MTRKTVAASVVAFSFSRIGKAAMEVFGIMVLGKYCFK